MQYINENSFYEMPPNDANQHWINANKCVSVAKV